MSVIITKADDVFLELKNVGIADLLVEGDKASIIEYAASITAAALTLWDQAGANVITKEVVLQSKIGRCGISPITSDWVREHYPDATYEVRGTFILPGDIVHFVIAYL